ncbi:uncharacterized protein LOC127867574 [Dreissena polymorpha]|uniref:uncharacterized protein LOC127867574 n=1 Tax=Dreissena polymorpha TaxID=45954 RepID=UPI0022640861|nr:uncharacterized protein LOC127867574 [Dreissena polymorpha]
MFLVIILIGCFVTDALGQNCPADRRIDGFTCGGGRGSIECPTGSQCVLSPGGDHRYCCWDATTPGAAPCDDPMVNSGVFTQCTPGQDSTCPGSCHTCEAVGSQGMNMGLCCPQVTRPGCENSSPALVAFEAARRRIIGSRGGTSIQGGAFQSQDTTGFQSATETSVEQPTRTVSPCGGDTRPTAYCGSVNPCSTGQRCVGIGFGRGVCCPDALGMSTFMGTGGSAQAFSQQSMF